MYCRVFWEHENDIRSSHWRVRNSIALYTYCCAMQTPFPWELKFPWVWSELNPSTSKFTVSKPPPCPATELWKSCVCTFQVTDYSLGYSLLSLAGHPKQRSSVTRNGFSTKPDLQNREAERQFIQQMKEKCDEQTRRLSRIQEELRRTGCGFDVFVITTQHFFRKVGLFLLSIFRMLRLL